MKQRLKVVAYWSFLNVLVFGCLELIIPMELASCIAMIVCASAFMDEKNWKDQMALTRPIIWVKNNER